jgi:hypothetical protein
VKKYLRVITFRYNIVDLTTYTQEKKILSYIDGFVGWLDGQALG